MTMSNQCKWISFGVMSLAVILLLLLFYSLETNKCPEEGQLRFKDDDTCYGKATRGPCKDNFIFWEDGPKSHTGSCSCPYMRTNRTILHHKDNCYYIFSRAFCSEGQWLNVTLKGEPICVPNRCVQHEKNGFEADKNANDDGEQDYKSKDQYDQNAHGTNGHRVELQKSHAEWVPIKGGRCAKLGEYAEGCPEGSVVRFHKGFILPSCFTPPKKLGESYGAIGVGAYTSCPLGSAKAITGFCQPVFDFDFEEPADRSSDAKSS